MFSDKISEEKVFYRCMFGDGMLEEKDFKKLKSRCTIGGKLDQKLLSSITGMQHGKGMMTAEEFDTFMATYTP